MIKQIHHIGINISDINRSMSFYQEHLGAAFVRGMYNPVIEKLIVYMQIDNLLLELMSPRLPSPKEQPGIIHIAFQVTDHENEASRIHGLGYPFITKPRRAGSGAGQICFFEAPGHMKTEFIERPEEPYTSWQPNAGIKGCPFVVLSSKDYEQSRIFYSCAAQMKELPVNHCSGYFTLNSTSLLLTKEKDSSESSYKGIALSCDSLPKKLDHLEKAGIPVYTEINSQKSCPYICDPDGIRYFLF